MFQYAIGRHLSIKYNRSLYLCKQLLGKGKPPRPMCLNLFSIAGTVLEDGDARLSDRKSRSHYLISDHGIRYHSGILKDLPSADCTLEGRWQSEMYFRDIASVIASDFRLPEKGPMMGAISDALRGKNSVCLHVRRTDYLTEGASLGFVGLGYYERAIAYLAKHLDYPTFYVFSDDIIWCEKHLIMDHPHQFVRYGNGGSDAALVMTLMSSCNHFIIANSTFSWWSAWLGERPDKVVVAPIAWFHHERLEGGASWRMPAKSTDIIPTAWVRI
jgi:hypothetical protein